MTKPTIAILGAGPAGLAAAFCLARRGEHHVVVLEASERVGGAAGTIDVGGVRCDFGSHRLHPACAPEILADIRDMLGADILTRPRHGRIRIAGRWVQFPLRPLDLLTHLPARMSWGLARDLLSRRDSAAEPATFAAELERRFGPTLCREFYFPYARKLWGLEPTEISAVQAAKRVRSRSLAAVAARALRALGGRAPHFLYPRHGFGQIAEAYAHRARQAGAEIILGDPVVAVEPADGRLHAIRTGAGRRITPTLCFSTLSLPQLARIAIPKPSGTVLEAAGRLRFRSMVLVYLILEMDRFSEWDAHYFPGADVRMSRLSEPKWYRDDGEPRGLTVLCAEIPCDSTDPVWQAGEAALARAVVDDLTAAGVCQPAPVTGVHVERLAAAYPVYHAGFEPDLGALAAWAAGVTGLISFGRQGLFVHDNAHHALEMGYDAAACVTKERFDTARWRRALARFAENTVED